MVSDFNVGDVVVIHPERRGQFPEESFGDMWHSGVRVVQVTDKYGRGIEGSLAYRVARVPEARPTVSSEPQEWFWGEHLQDARGPW